MRIIEIYCENTQRHASYPLGTTLEEIAIDQRVNLRFPVCGVLVNNKIKDLSYELIKPKTLKFIDYTHPEGKRMYVRSLVFLLYAAVCKVFPGIELNVDHAISKGYYCELEDLKRDITDEDVAALKGEMLNLVQKNIPFERKGMKTEKVVEMFRTAGFKAKARLFEDKGNLYSYAYFMNDKINHFYGHLVPSTGFINLFGLERLYYGLLLRVPDPEKENELMEFVPQEKLFDIFQEHKDRAKIHNVSVLASLNKFIRRERIGDVIKVSEAMHEKKIAEIASDIYLQRRNVKLVMVAGPSSSGKTTFSKRLAVQLAVCGLKPLLLSLDDYFVDREQTPLDEHGEYDFESLEAVDVDFFNKNLLELLDGNEVVLPKFDFKTGKRYFNGHKMCMKEDNVLIVEGIHGLNPGLVPYIDQEKMFKIFISALTQISVDEHNYISTTDNRLARRIIRDSRYRNYSTVETIRRWPSVRKGEEQNIFPFQENADIMFNSALIYELGVMKNCIEPLLKSVPENQPEYSEAVRLLKFFALVKPIDGTEIPPTSLLREFLGGSSFVY